jgi:outer membrane protein
MVRGAAILSVAGVILVALGGQRADAQGVTLEETIERILARNPQVSVQRARVDEAQGSVQTTNGAFDWALAAQLLNDRRVEGDFSSSTGAETQTKTLTDDLIVQASRYFTNGWTLTLRSENVRSRLRNAASGSIGRVEPSATLNVPLLKDRGEDSALAAKREAKALLGSVKLDSRFQVTSLINSGISGYWNSRALDQNITILEQTSKTLEDISTVLKDHSDAGEISRSDYQRALADLRRRQNNVLAATRDAYRARQELAVILGMDKVGDEPRAATPFPDLMAAAEVDRLDLKRLSDLAYGMRLDLGSLDEKFRAQEINLGEMVRDLRPQLDLGMTLGYSAARNHFSLTELDELYVDQSERDWPNYTVGLLFSYPLGNNAAEGRAASSRAGLIKARGDIDGLKNTIRSNVAIAINDLQSSLKELARAKEALELLEDVSSEMTRKLYLGETSLSDFIDVQDDLTQSRLDVVNATRNYAIGLANLRFQTGTLGVSDGTAIRVESYMLRTLPQPAEAPQAR